MSRHSSSPRKATKSSTANENIGDLVRLLNLLPYFQSHPGRSIMAAAADLGLPIGQLKQDLFRLLCCGPGVYPDELVDLDVDNRAVQILDSQGMDKPLRLTLTEATALVMALEYLESVPGLVDREAVVSAATKLRAVMGDNLGAVFDTDSTGRDTVPEPNAEALAKAMREGQQIQFRYASQSSGEVAVRTVSVQRLFTHNTHGYMHALDHDRGEIRVFRLDRMQDVTQLEVPATRVELEPLDVNDPFNLREAATRAVLLFEEDSAWLADTFPTADGFWNDEDFYEVEVPLISREWLIRFALENADRVRVVSPVDIPAEIRRRAEIAIQAYDGREAESL